MTFNTNQIARELRKQLVPKQYTHTPYQWAYVAAIHSRTTTTLSANALAGATSIQSHLNWTPNTLIVVGTGGPVVVKSTTGSGPYTSVIGPRGIPFAASSGATVIGLATLDIYLDGWQNPPANLPPGVTPTLTIGVRYLHGYTPAVGHVVLVGRGTGLQRSDRFVLGRLA